MEYKEQNIEFRIWNMEYWIRVFPNSKFQIPNSACRGFTILEILITIGILAILLTAIIPSFLNFRRNSILNTETQNVITLINKARMATMSAKGDLQYGVHLETGKVVLFQGAIYTAGAGTNEEYLLQDTTSLSSVVVNGGGANIVFQKITGATSQNATTTLLITGTTASTTIIIRPTGVATIN